MRLPGRVSMDRSKREDQMYIANVPVLGVVVLVEERGVFEQVKAL